MTEAPTAQPKHRRWKPLLILVVILLALAGWWRMTQPPAFQFEGCYPFEGYNRRGEIIVCDEGLLCLDININNPTTGELPLHIRKYDWQAKQQWMLAIPESSPASPSGYDIYASLRAVAFSPNKHILAAIVVHNQTLKVYTWRDHQSLWCCTIPLTNGLAHFDEGIMLSLAITAMDDGRVFFYRDTGRISPLLLINGNRVVASGLHQTPFHLTSADRYHRVIAADGSTLICASNDYARQYEYVTITRAGSKITATSRYTETLPGNGTWQVGTHGAFVTSDGTCYGPAGRLRTCPGWTFSHFPRDPLDDRRPVPLPNNVPRPRVIQEHGGAKRLYEPGNDIAWPLPNDLANVQPSEDARFLLAEQPGCRNTHLLGGLQHLVALHPRFTAVYERIRDARSLLLYARHQRTPRARLVVYRDPDGFRTVIVKGKRYYIEQIVFDPAQHRLAIYADGTADQAGQQFLLFYTWK